MNLGTRQFRRQGFALRLSLGLRFRKLCQFFGDRRHVGSEGFFKQLPLFNRQAFGLDAEVVALVDELTIVDFPNSGRSKNPNHTAISQTLPG